MTSKEIKDIIKGAEIKISHFNLDAEDLNT